MRRRRTKYLPIIVLLAISQPACDLNFSGIGEGIGEGVGHFGGFPEPMGPWSPDPVPAIRVSVQPFRAVLVNSIFGAIRDGAYIDSFRVYSIVFDVDSAYGALTLKAGFDPRPGTPGRRPGTYDVTVAAPGYVTWDTTGVVVQADSAGVVWGVRLSAQLVEVP